MTLYMFTEQPKCSTAPKAIEASPIEATSTRTTTVLYACLSTLINYSGNSIRTEFSLLSVPPESM